MAITLKYDTVANASLDRQSVGSQRVRGVLATGIPISVGTSDPMVLEKVYDAIIADVPIGTKYDVSRPDLVFRRLIVRPRSQTTAEGLMIYSSDIEGLQPSAYLFRDSTYLTSYQTNLVPGTRHAIRVKYDDPGGNHGNDIPEDAVSFTFMVPMHVLSVSAYIYGTPNNSARTNVGKVNADYFMDYAPGYWLMSKYETTTSRYSGAFSLNVEVMSKIQEDFSYTGVLRSQQTGKYAKPTDSDIDSLMATPYAYGYTTVNGAVRVGPYKTAHFGSILGISSRPSFGLVSNP